MQCYVWWCWARKNAKCRRMNESWVPAMLHLLFFALLSVLAWAGGLLTLIVKESQKETTSSQIDVTGTKTSRDNGDLCFCSWWRVVIIYGPLFLFYLCNFGRLTFVITVAWWCNKENEKGPRREPSFHFFIGLFFIYFERREARLPR